MTMMNRFPDPEDHNSIFVAGPDGQQIRCDVLFTFTGETGKDYIVYTDNSQDGDGNLLVYANVYDPGDPNSPLEEIETEAEWDVIQRMLTRIQALMQQAAAGGEPVDMDRLARQLQEEFGDGEDEEGNG